MSTAQKDWLGLFLVAAAYGIGFVIVWGGAHWLTELNTERWSLYFHWEMKIPFQIWAVPLYFSMDILVAIAPFLFHTWRQAAPLMATFLVQLCIAAPFFVLVPIDPGFVNDMSSGVWGAYLFEPLGLHNMSQFNHTPSLHVTYALTLALALKQWRPTWIRWLWAIPVCSTTVLVHEHHVVCLAGGLVLYLATAWTVLPFFERHFNPRSRAFAASAG